FAASYWKCLTLILGPNGFICGPALWSRQQRIGFRRIAVRCLHKLSSLLARRERPTCRVSLWTIAASFPSSHTLSSILAGTRPRGPSERARQCYLLWWPMNPPPQPPSPPTAARSPPTPPTTV